MTPAQAISFLGIVVVGFAAALLQFSFFPALLGASPDLLFVLSFCVIFFAGSAYEKITAIVVAGLFLDVFSGVYFGIHIVALLLIYGFERLAFHFLRGNRRQPSVIYFAALFTASFFLYMGMQYGLSFVTSIRVATANALLAEFILSGLAALIGMYLYQRTVGNKETANQLTLFK